MKKWIPTFSLLVLLSLLHACANPAKENGLRLDDGKKWRVSEAMQAPLSQAELRLALYLSEAENDYQALAADIEAYNQALISSCDMEGESHAVLHKWLHPHLEIVKALKSAQTKEEAATLIEELQLSYGTYHKYFE